MKKVRVLFVCLGNICRSPLGAAVMKKKVRDYGLEDYVEVDSCGTSDYHIGEGADPRTQASAARHGVPMEHSARQLIAGDLQNFDFIMAMDKNNYRHILQLAPDKDVTRKVMLMREFDPEARGGEVPDPYHGGEEGFQEVFEILDRSTEHFIRHLRKEYGF